MQSPAFVNCERAIAFVTLSFSCLKSKKKGLYEAIKGAPEILFVVGSGNENNDANFSEYIPATFDLPNIITVGAVDSEGKPIDFYADDYEVEFFVPGGDRLKMSGTSMASPEVASKHQ